MHLSSPRLLGKMVRMTAGQVDYGSWLLKVIGCDGLMPACVVFAPIVVRALFPNSRAAIEIIAVALPIAAFLFRAILGMHHIGSNNCVRAVRRVQLGIFCVGIVILALIDCFLILSHLMPDGALFAEREDRVVWLALISTYLLAMTIAMYPGRAEVSSPN